MNTWRRGLESEVWTAGFEYSWRLKSTSEAAAQDRTGWRKWSVAYAPLGATRHKSIKDEECRSVSKNGINDGEKVVMICTVISTQYRY